MRTFQKGDRVRYEQFYENLLWGFRIGREGTVTRDQEPEDVTVPVHFDGEEDPVYPFAVNLKLVSASASVSE